MPDCRAALGALAAADVAFLAVPHPAKAESPDADLIALTLKAKAKYSELRTFERVLSERCFRFTPPAVSATLIATADDKRYLPRLKAQWEPHF